MTKIQHTETHDNTLVCKGKLGLIPINVGQYVANKKHSVVIGNFMYKPIIISETEEIEKDSWLYLRKDKGWSGSVVQNQFGVMGSVIGTKEYIKDNCYKILSLPENFSSEILKDIVDGRLKHGDEVRIQCENKYIEPEGIHCNRGADVLIIKLNKDNHITILPEKKEWGWEDIEAKFRQTDDYKFTTARNINSAFVGWLQDNYNPPTKK